MGKIYKQGSQRVLDPDSNEYYRLEMFNKMLNRDSPNKHIYRLQTVYLDFGQDWKWTTIVDETAGCQVLNPLEWFEILNEERPLDDIEKDFFADEYCQDKLKEN